MSEYKKQNSRQIRFNELDELVWKHARDNFEGNFNMAARDLVKKGLKDE